MMGVYGMLRRGPGALLPALPDPGRALVRPGRADQLLVAQHRAGLDVLRDAVPAGHPAALRVREPRLLRGALAPVPDQCDATRCSSGCACRATSCSSSAACCRCSSCAGWACAIGSRRSRWRSPSTRCSRRSRHPRESAHDLAAQCPRRGAPGGGYVVILLVAGLGLERLARRSPPSGWPSLDTSDNEQAGGWASTSWPHLTSLAGTFSSGAKRRAPTSRAPS